MMKKITFDEALSHIKNTKLRKSERVVKTADAAGKTLSKSVYAKYSVPIAPLSGMDGFAIKSVESKGASHDNPIVLKSFKRVNTGNAVPAEFDAVIKIEETSFEEPKNESDKISEIKVLSETKAGENVRAIGEDIKEGAIILPAGAVIRPFDIGALLSFGITEVHVLSITAEIIPTGTELIEPGAVPKPGQVVESNSKMVAAYLKELGVDAVCHAPVADNPEMIEAALKSAAESKDLVLIIAGSSMGNKDFTSSSISSLGKLIFHGVFIKPGKPVMFGIINDTPIIGLPGYPISAQMVTRLFVRELLKCLGLPIGDDETVNVKMGDTMIGHQPLDEFCLQSVGVIGGEYVCIPQPRASSMNMNTIRANAYIRIPRGVDKITCGEKTDAVLTVKKEELDKTILVGGTPDPAFAEIMEECQKLGCAVRFGDLNVKSGVKELKNRTCHAAVVKTDSDISELDGIELEKIKISEDAAVIYRKDMELEPMTALLVSAAEKHRII